MATQMIDSEGKGEAAITGTSINTFLKQPSAPLKKAALRDVQNDNRNLKHNQDTSPYAGGKPISDEIKFSKAKRPTPERHSSSPNQPSWSSHSTNEHLLNVRRRFELELDKGRFQKSIGKSADCPQLRNFCLVQQEVPQKQTQTRKSTAYHAPLPKTNCTSPAMIVEHGGLSASNFIGQPGNGLQVAESDFPKITSDIPHLHNSEDTNDQQWRERFIHLQHFLKQSDESNQSNYIQVLLRFSPAELSRHAVDLEKRAIQLTIEEGKEMQRMKSLNILGKSVATSSPLQTTQLLVPKSEN